MRSDLSQAVWRQLYKTFLQSDSGSRLFALQSRAARPFALCTAYLISILAGLADPMPARYLQGTIHGFLEMRDTNGRVVAAGDLIRVIKGDEVTSRAIFHFKDGSVDDETTVYTQRDQLRLISDRHIQTGPSFPHPLDLMIDCRGGQVTVRSEDKSGKKEVKTEHMDLPPDLANGIVPMVLENMTPKQAANTISMVVATPKPRLVKLAISSRGPERFSVAGLAHEAVRYEIKVELGGIAGTVAPLIGKQPANIEAWVVAGDAPTFIREQGQIYPDGPIMNITFASPVWKTDLKTGTSGSRISNSAGQNK